MRLQLPALRHPMSPIERVKRQFRRIATYLGRRVRDQDYKTMRWLVGRYLGPTEVTSVFFINLDSSPERRSDMERSLTRVKAPFERYRGVNGAQELEAHSEYLSQRPPLPPSRRPSGEIVPYELTDGTVGCWLSHVHLIKHISTLDEGLYLVLEDDYGLPRNWAQKVDALLSEIPDDWDILKLYTRALNGKPRLRGVRISEHLVRLGPALFTQQNLSAGAYVIRHRMPRTGEIISLLENTPIMHYDDALNFLMDDIRIYAAREQIGTLTPLGVFTTR